MKRTILILVLFILVGNVYAGSKDRTPWHELKKHWEESKTKDDDLCLEYMTRVDQFDYTVPHNSPIRKVAVLPPVVLGKFPIDTIVYFEKEVLFNTKEMEDEYKVEPKKWKATKSFKESYKIMKEGDLYDKYLASAHEFVAYRSIDKKLFSEIGNLLDADTVLLFLMGTERPGLAAAGLKSEAYFEVRMPLIDVFLIDVKEGKIISEYGCILTDDKKVYRNIFQAMPIE